MDNLNRHPEFISGSVAVHYQQNVSRTGIPACQRFVCKQLVADMADKNVCPTNSYCKNI
jgi:hypothetical protein